MGISGRSRLIHIPRTLLGSWVLIKASWVLILCISVHSVTGVVGMASTARLSSLLFVFLESQSDCLCDFIELFQCDRRVVPLFAFRICLNYPPVPFVSLVNLWRVLSLRVFSQNLLQRLQKNLHLFFDFWVLLFCFWDSFNDLLNSGIHCLCLLIEVLILELVIDAFVKKRLFLLKEGL